MGIAQAELTTAPLPASAREAEKRRQLALAKRRATMLLGAVAVVFAITTIAGHGATWVGYVQATAEASLVGGLADWFAVVALFRHPLGVPIPHTAIVVERKAQFGETLGDFIENSFLTPETIAERVRGAQVGRRLADWLVRPANASRLAGHIVDGVVAVADLLKEDEVHQTIERLVRERLDDVPLAPTAGRALQFVIAEGRHREVLDAAIKGLDGYVAEHADELRQRLGQQSPWWLPGAVEDRIFERLIDGAHLVLQDMAADPEHQLRHDLESRLQQFAHDLETSPDLRDRGEQLKHDLLAQPQLRTWVASLWTDVKATLRAQADDPDSVLRMRLADLLVTAGQRLHDDPELAAKVENGVQSGANYVAEHFNGEIAALVSATINRWDAEETSHRLELLLGPDLQFIRINGTVVGAAAGLALYTIAQMLS